MQQAMYTCYSCSILGSNSVNLPISVSHVPGSGAINATEQYQFGALDLMLNFYFNHLGHEIATAWFPTSAGVMQ